MLTWSAMMVLISLAVMAVAVWGWVQRNMGRSASNGGSAALPVPVQGERVNPLVEAPSKREALSVVERALAIREASAVTDYFRPGSSSPEQIIGFLRDLEKVDGTVEDMTWLGSMNANGLAIEGVLVKSSLDDRPHNRLAFLTPGETGEWKIDFDAFARTVSPSWAELLEGSAAEGVVRVVVTADSYFNGPFRDDTQWGCYGMASPDVETMLMGYCQKDSPQAKAMKWISADEDLLSGVRKSKRATLEIRRVEGSEARQFEITRVLAEDWVQSAVPFDMNFQ